MEIEIYLIFWRPRDSQSCFDLNKAGLLQHFVCWYQFSLMRLQLVQNAAARFLMGKILSHLHWLPVKHRIECKVLTLVFKALHGLAPVYMSDLICPFSPPRLLDLPMTTISHLRFKSKGDRAFCVFGPRLRNSLPQSDSFFFTCIQVSSENTSFISGLFITMDM